MDSVWASSRPQELTDELRFLPQEEFSLGGLYGLGGPAYAHSCVNAASDPPSWFLLHHINVALTPDSLVMLSGWLTANDTTSKRVGTGARVERQALSLREVADARFQVFQDTGLIVLRCTPPSAMCESRLRIAIADSNAGQAFAGRALSTARRLQTGKGEPR